jgi:hypothetical protein
MLMNCHSGWRPCLPTTATVPSHACSCTPLLSRPTPLLATALSPHAGCHRLHMKTCVFRPSESKILPAHDACFLLLPLMYMHILTDFTACRCSGVAHCSMLTTCPSSWQPSHPTTAAVPNNASNCTPLPLSPSPGFSLSQPAGLIVTSEDLCWPTVSREGIAAA